MEIIIFKKILNRFGGNLRIAVSGASALSPSVAEFVNDIGISLYEGYGLSENTAALTVNYPGARRFGSVGKPLPGVKIEIDKSVKGSLEEDGEVVAFGENIMLGYPIETFDIDVSNIVGLPQLFGFENDQLTYLIEGFVYQKPEKKNFGLTYLPQSNINMFLAFELTNRYWESEMVGMDNNINEYKSLYFDKFIILMFVLTLLNDITDFNRKKKFLSFLLPLLFIALTVGTEFGSSGGPDNIFRWFYIAMFYGGTLGALYMSYIVYDLTIVPLLVAMVTAADLLKFYNNIL